MRGAGRTAADQREAALQREPAGGRRSQLDVRIQGTNATTFTHGPSGTIAAEGPVEGTIAGLLPQTQYSFRLLASNKHGSGESSPESFTTPSAVAGLTGCTASGETSEAATLHASLQGAPTVSYASSMAPAKPTVESKVKVSGGAGAETDNEPLASLEPNRIYDCRLAATRELESKTFTTYGESGSFKTLALKPH